MPEEMKYNRRHFLGTAVMTLTALELGMVRFAVAQASQKQSTKAETKTSFLLHGWPYDIHSYVDVAQLLAAKGYRVIVPYLRGYGSTRFLSGETARHKRTAIPLYGDVPILLKVVAKNHSIS